MSNFFSNLRIKNNFTQDQFARCCGIKQSYWSKVENFKEIPRIEILNKVALQFKIPSCDLAKLYLCNECLFKNVCKNKINP